MWILSIALIGLVGAQTETTPTTPTTTTSTGSTELAVVPSQAPSNRKVIKFPPTKPGNLTETLSVGSYMIIAPRVIRPNLPYSCSVSILKQIPNLNAIQLSIRNSTNDTLGTVTFSRFQIGQPQTVTIAPIPYSKLPSDDSLHLYALGMDSSSKMLFESLQYIMYNQKSMSIFVQTDKAIYKPSSTVYYRIILTEADLLPYKNKVSVKVVDPNQNIIQLKNNATLFKGIYESSLDLSSEPPIGDWTIQVESQSGVKFSKPFTVDKYVLPKFEVTITTPSIVTVNDTLSVIVTAKYTYGEAVAGKATVVFEQQYSWRPRPKLEKTVTLNGQGVGKVTVENEVLRKYDLVEDYGTTIKCTATVTEALTDIQLNGTTTITFQRNDVKLEVNGQADSFKPGLDFSVVVALKMVDDTPITAKIPRNVQVTVTYNYPYPFNPFRTTPYEDKHVQVIELDTDGTAILDLQPPLKCTAMQIEVRYDRTGGDNYDNYDIYASTYVDAAKSPSTSFLQLTSTISNTVPAGGTASFNVKLTDKVPVITYQVMSRGVVVLSKQMSVNSDTASISFPTTSEMAPKSRLIVYAIRPANKEILVDATDFEVKGLFRNNVSISVNPTSCEPADNVTFRVTADTNSYVGLLAIDQSVLLLKSGNDITQDLVSQDIAEYDTTGNNGRPRPWGIFRPWWPVGGNDAASIFQNAGLVVLTDALLYSQQPNGGFFPMMVNEEAAFGGAAAGMAAPGGPMMPMPAPVAAEDSSSSQAAPRTRTLFPETWVWMNLTSTNNGASYTATAPDTITSWVASAFAINERSGLGVAPTTAKLRVFRPFFIRLNLPYSVKRGEKFALQVMVFNYMDTPQDATVTLRPPSNGSFVLLNKDGTNNTGSQTPYNTRRVTVPGGGVAKAVYFPIQPLLIGDIPLHLTAQAAQAGDAIEMPLKVEPEGYRVDRNVPIVIELRNSTSFSRSVPLEFPSDIVIGSEKAKVEVIGDIMGPVLANLDKLVQMPSGCGEQNMLNFVPNIVVMQYLKAINRSDPALTSKALKYMQKGYQGELSYRRDDNSYSAFGQSDDHGSTWLTAFVVRSFKQAQEFIYIDQATIQKSIDYLNGTQQANGSFVELGQVLHKDMMGGASSGGLSLTAYCVVTLLENKVRNAKAIALLENNLQRISSDTYTLAVTTYALTLAKSTKAQQALNLLEAKRIVGDDGSVHYESSKKPPPPPKDYWYFFQPRPVDVELSSYVLLTYMLRGDTNKGYPIVRWLSSQRNALGGFSSTQDTVVALQALGQYAAKTYVPDSNVVVKVANGADNHQFQVTPENSIVLQGYELENKRGNVSVDATGRGIAFSQVSYSYHLTALRNDTPFFCNKTISISKTGKRLTLKMCCHYTRTGSSNMAVAEIQALTGFTFDESSTSLLTETPSLQRVELQNEDTQVNVYFSGMNSKPICFTLHSDLSFQVTNQKPAQVSLYDYYDPIQELKLSYTTTNQNQTLQEFCPECWPTGGVVSGGSQTTTAAPRGRRYAIPA